MTRTRRHLWSHSCVPLLILAAATCTIAADEVSTAAESARRALVSIRCVKSDGTVSEGSGFIVDSSGVVVTNYHVVEGAKTVSVKTASGDIYDGVGLAGLDVRRDLALIRFSGYGLPVLKLGDAGLAKPGAQVVVVSNPLGLEGSVSTGVVAALRDSGEGYKLLQLTAAVSRGSSGAPVLDLEGNVLGVVTFKVLGGESLHFAIPAEYVKGMMANSKQLDLDLLSSSSSSPRGLFDAPSRPPLTSVAQVKKICVRAQQGKGVEDSIGLVPLCVSALETELTSAGFQTVLSAADADAEFLVSFPYTIFTEGPILLVGSVVLSYGGTLRATGSGRTLFGHSGQASTGPAKACQKAARDFVQELVAARGTDSEKARGVE